MSFLPIGLFYFENCKETTMQKMHRNRDVGLDVVWGHTSIALNKTCTLEMMEFLFGAH